MATRNPSRTVPLSDVESEQTIYGASNTPDATTTPTRGEVVSLRVTDENDDSIVDRVRAMLGETPDDKARVRLYRIDSRTGTLQHCRVYTPSEFESTDIDGVRVEWGPGEYEIRITGQRGILGKSRVNIAAPVVGAVSSRESDGLVMQQLRAMQDANAQQMAALTQVLSQVAQATQARPVDDGASLLKSIAALAQLRDVFAPSTPTPPAADPMAMFAQVMNVMRESRAAIRELVEEEAPKRVDPENPLSMVGDVIELVKLGMAQNQSQSPGGMVPPVPSVRVPASVQQAAAPAVDAQPSPDTPAEETHTQESPMQIIVRGLIEDLCALAEKGSDTQAGAEFIFENLPDEAIPYMRHRLWFEALAAQFPVLRKHETWIREAKGKADAMFAAEDQGG